MPRHTLVMLFRDSNGRSGKMHWDQADTNTALATAILPLSNAGLEGLKDIRHLADANTSPTVATYLTVQDKAWMDWRTTAGLTPVKSYIPAPKSTVFGSDQINVDQTAAAVITYVAAALLVLTDNNDNLVNANVGGRRRNRKRKGQ